MENKSTVWMLGSNSRRGFHSLYDAFHAGEGRLYIIKGGPGTGKSTFMRRLAAAAEDAGYEVEYIVCSGDPDSLDAIFIPGLGVGYADGTSPHVLDPAVFGADGGYINIGRFCSDGVASHSGELRALTADYRLWYRRAYELLGAAAAVSPALSGAYATDEARAAAAFRASGVARRELDGRSGAKAKISHRFLGSLTCRGRVLLAGTLDALCQRLFLLDNRLGLGFEFTRELARQAEARGERAVICPHWLEPEKIEAVVFPDEAVGFAVLDPLAKYPEQHRRLHLDRLCDGEAQRALRPQLREDEKLEERLLVRAGQCLAAAKELHDELEAVYRPWVDFDALTQAADREITRLLG